jgi:hypothetical protein
MSTGAIGNFSNSYLQQILASALQSAGINANTSSTSNASGVASSSPFDSTQLSPFAQLASALQQLQQSDPAKYAQVTKQIATNLQSAAQTAQSQGNQGAANQLTQLASDFSTASQTGQLPNLQDLAEAVAGGGGHHHHHHGGGASDSSSTAGSTSSASSGGSATSPASQLLTSLFQTNSSQSTPNASLNPEAIIRNTLTSAGINVSNS